MATLAEYHTALSNFTASPTETTKAAVLTARAALPDSVSGDGVTTTLPSLDALASTLSATLTGLGVASSFVTPRRFLRAGCSHQ